MTTFESLRLRGVYISHTFWVKRKQYCKLLLQILQWNVMSFFLKPYVIVKINIHSSRSTWKVYDLERRVREVKSKCDCILHIVYISWQYKKWWHVECTAVYSSVYSYVLFCIEKQNQSHKNAANMNKRETMKTNKWHK